MGAGLHAAMRGLHQREPVADRLAAGIEASAGHFDGITITGGEPFDQYEPLLLFCACIKKTTALNIYAFTGYRLEELMKKHPDRLFVQYIDFLMDGRYEKDRHDDRNVMGSSNQRLYSFEEGVPVEQADYFPSNKWSVAVSDDGDAYMAGIPRQGDMEAITTELEKSGIKVKF
jgi:anaerobic ribonucleoside-triphosphate reductase activating protein